MIEPQIVLQRERMLPQVGELIGSIGSEVTPMQVVGRSQIAGGYVVVNASEQLDLAPDMLTAYLRVGEGDLVETGDVLLRRGRWGTKVMAPAAGRVHAVQNGRLLLQRPFVWHELRALLRGTIINQLPQRGVVIETTGAYIQGRWGTQQEGFGRLRLLTETAEGILTAESWMGELARHVVVAGQVASGRRKQRRRVNCGHYARILDTICPNAPLPAHCDRWLWTTSHERDHFQFAQKAGQSGNNALWQDG